MPHNRVKTGIPGLDPMLEGGYMPGTANLIEGAPGIGLVSKGLKFKLNLKGRPVSLVSGSPHRMSDSFVEAFVKR